MRQLTFATEAFEKYRKLTRKEQFLNEMKQVIPWQELMEVIEPYYPVPKGAGRRGSLIRFPCDAGICGD